MKKYIIILAAMCSSTAFGYVAKPLSAPLRLSGSSDSASYAGLSATFTSHFSATYARYKNSVPAEAAPYNRQFLTLGLPLMRITKAYDRVSTNWWNKNVVHHTIKLSGHIKCQAGDDACNNALYTLHNSSHDFKKCMHNELSHPEIPRTQRCQSLFASLGSYGPGDRTHNTPHALHDAWWTFDVTLDDE